MPRIRRIMILSKLKPSSCKRRLELPNLVTQLITLAHQFKAQFMLLPRTIDAQPAQFDYQRQPRTWHLLDDVSRPRALSAMTPIKSRKSNYRYPQRPGFE